MRIVSIQSHVALGHVGNSAAVFALRRLGHEVWPVHTVHLSNHPGYGDAGGGRAAPVQVEAILDGLLRREAITGCDAVLSGYLGAPEVAAVVARFVTSMRERAPGCRYCCDPVMGDRETGLYVDPSLPEAFASTLLPLADVLTPNVFELERLVGRALGTTGAIEAACREVTRRGPAVVAVTGLEDRDRTIGALAVEGDAIGRVDVPRLDLGRRPDGAGDLTTALFLAGFLESGNAAAALADAVSVTHAMLASAARNGDRELPLVREQTLLAAPPTRFEPRRISARPSKDPEPTP